MHAHLCFTALLCTATLMHTCHGAAACATGLRAPVALGPAGLPPLIVRPGVPQGRRAGSPLRPGARSFSVNMPPRYDTTGDAAETQRLPMTCYKLTPLHVTMTNDTM